MRSAADAKRPCRIIRDMTSSAEDATLGAYRDALIEALTDGAALSEARALPLLSHTLSETADMSDGELGALSVLAAAPDVDAAAHEAMSWFESPWALAQAIYFARCVAREPEAALRLAAFRRYATSAQVSTDLPDLALDQAAVLDASHFVDAWREPARIAWMLDTLQRWRRDFIFVYHARHTTDASSCVLDAELLAEALEQGPRCPRCHYQLGHPQPSATTRRDALTTTGKAR
jgi:hypothetical protein